ncbi:MAG: hypothetical protein JW986_09130 [Methanotrichaceae archaeon]|nr:hypothetical protein [Methanotrichaceae archaeon]
MMFGISNSHRNQEAEYALRQVLKMFEERRHPTEIFSVRGTEIGFCRHCDWRLKNKECFFRTICTSSIQNMQR